MHSLRQTLQALPNGLYETYDRILLNVPEVHQAHVQRALVWLAFSRVPMTLSQVAEAVLVSREQQSMDPGDQFCDVHDLLDLCSSFVSLEETRAPWSPILYFRNQFGREKVASDADWVLRLAHSSVKEYMLSDRTNITPLSMHRLTSGIAQRFMAEMCQIYLNQFNDESSISDENLERHHFLSYVARHWYLHYDDMPAEEENNVVDLLLSFINTHYNGYAYRNWIKWLDRYSSRYWLVENNLRPLRPLAALSFMGSHRAVRAIVENAAEAHVNEDAIGESLICASGEGHEAVVRVLLDAGARLNRTGVIDASSLRQALSEATSAGRTELIELLIHKGAIAKSLDYRSVSEVAASQGKVHMVKLYLDWTTTDVNKTEVFYGALQAAITARQSSVVRYLLGGSDFEAREDVYSTTLRMAYLERDDSKIQFLIRALGPEATAIRRTKFKVLDTSWTLRTKLVILQILGADIDHPLLERNHERDYIPIGDAYWENAVEVEDTIKETLLGERKLLEEEELIEETMALLQRIRSLSTELSPAVETGSEGMV